MKKINEIEQYKDIKDYYYITNNGVVISKYNNKEKILSPSSNKGYLQVGLMTNDKKRICAFIHRLVALSYVNNDSLEYKIEVNHIDGDKSNNHFSNLEWVTSEQNSNHGTRNNKVAKQFEKKVVQYDLFMNIVNKYDSIKEANIVTNIHRGAIGQCCLNKRKTAGGFIWRYDD